ncbi:DUF6326 family protein [Arenibacterium sp. LLYu02]|uniref:DUF6326 family protein n=1 Tax=Arenibacterium sp. LLYu02 TaxID=3404132 RepID=UPI003B221EE6
MPVQLKLAAAWTSFMFFYIYVDYLILYKPGHVQNILDGRVWEFDLNQTFATVAFVSLAVPIFMILLSVALSGRGNRTLNIVVAVLYIPYSIFNAAGETWTVFFGLSIGLEVGILSYIVLTACNWPHTATIAEDAA